MDKYAVKEGKMNPYINNIEWRWKNANEKTNTNYSTITEKLGMVNNLFGRDGNDDVFYLPQEEVEEECSQLVNTNQRLFGCTRQEAMDTNLLEKESIYERPYTRTYISQEWNTNDIDKVMDHELAHQAIYTTGQGIQNDYNNRVNLGLKTPNKGYMSQIMNRLKLLDAEIDCLDKAYSIPNVGVFVNKFSNVYPELESIVNDYINATME